MGSDGGPAFPNEHTSGMSLRDYFAAKAMQGILSTNKEAEAINLAENAYFMADAMLKEREKKL